MAENTSIFGGLVKLTTTDYSKYNDQKQPGRIIFAEVTEGERKGQFIWAHGVEYNVADASLFRDLVADLSTYVHVQVDGSIADLSTYVYQTVDTSIFDISTYIHNVLDVSLADLSTYVHTQVDGSIADLSTRMKSAIVNSSISTFINGKDATVRLDVIRDGSTRGVSDEHTDIYIKSGNYVNVVEDTVEGNAIKLDVSVHEDVSTATEHSDGLATAKGVKDFVETYMGDIADALTFEGGSDDLTAECASTALTDKNVGDTFVIDKPKPAEGQPGYDGKYLLEVGGNVYHLEMGDIVIVKDVSNGSVADVIAVERNLDGVVTCASTLTAGKIVIGDGNQAAHASHIDITDASIAIDLARTAIQNITVNTSTGDYVTLHTAEDDASVFDISFGVVVKDPSAATAKGEGLADAYDVQKYVEEQFKDVTFRLDSSHPYITTTQYVDGTGRHIDASVGLVVVTLADASNGSTGLAKAEDVYEELVKVEETMAAAMTATAETLGLEPDFSVDWTHDYLDGSTYKQAIEYAHTKIDNIDSQTFIGEDIAERPNDEYVAVKATTEMVGDVKQITLDASVQLAADVPNASLPTGYVREASTGLAVDTYVRDYVAATLAWVVINDD